MSNEAGQRPRVGRSCTMSTKRMDRISRVQGFLLAGLGALAIGLAGCSGDEGPSSPTTPPPDPVFPPGPGSGVAIPITTAKSIVGSITRVTVAEDGKPVVEIYLRDEQNFSLKGLPAANVSFVLARLEPGTNGASSTWHAITRKTEAFPERRRPRPQAVTGTGPATRPRPRRRRPAPGRTSRTASTRTSSRRACRATPRSRSTARCRTASASKSG